MQLDRPLDVCQVVQHQLSRSVAVARFNRRYDRRMISGAGFMV